MRKILIKLISAKTTLEYYSGRKIEWWIADAIKDIDNAIDEIMRRYEDDISTDKVSVND